MDPHHKTVSGWNISTVTLICTVCYGCRYFIRWLDVIAEPLVATKLFSVILFIWQLCGFYFLQGNRLKCIKTLRSFVQSGAIVIAFTVFFHILAIVFGAAVFENVAETFHLAMLLSTVTAVPCLCVFGSNLQHWLRIFTLSGGESCLETSVMVTSIFAIIGAWFGAFPIPLDWDRPWQVWPISCVIGTLAGYSIGLVWASVRIANFPQLSKVKAG